MGFMVLATEEVEDVVNHREMALASQTLQDILAEAASRPWVLQDHAEMRSTWSLNSPWCKTRVTRHAQLKFIEACSW